jgi:hypothetical protein
MKEILRASERVESKNCTGEKRGWKNAVLGFAGGVVRRNLKYYSFCLT